MAYQKAGKFKQLGQQRAGASFQGFLKKRRAGLGKQDISSSCIRFKNWQPRTCSRFLNPSPLISVVLWSCAPVRYFDSTPILDCWWFWELSESPTLWERKMWNQHSSYLKSQQILLVSRRNVNLPWEELPLTNDVCWAAGKHVS